MIGNVASERAILSGLFHFGIDAHIDVCDLIDTKSFTQQTNSLIYKCIVKALESTSHVDINSLLSAANDLHAYEILSKPSEMDFLRSLMNFPIKLENVRGHAAKIKKLQLTREIEHKFRDSIDKLQEVTGNESVDQILGIAEAPLTDILDSLGEDERTKLLFQNKEEYLQHLEENQCEQKGISTGFPIFDYRIGGGIRLGGVNLVGARAKVGKTTFGKEVALHISMNLGIPVLMLDTEMNEEDQFNRSISSIAEVALKDIETGKFGKNKDKIYNSLKTLESVPYYYKNIAGKPFAEIISICRRWAKKEVADKPAVIIYDYFKLMDENDLKYMQEYQAVGFQISKLVDFTQKHKVGCLSFVQLNRDGIDKDTTGAFSQSDRLIWLASSVSILRRKVDEEVAEEGRENGNMKMIVMESRFAENVSTLDHINFEGFKNGISKMRELGTAFKAKARRQDKEQGFPADIDENVPFKS